MGSVEAALRHTQGRWDVTPQSLVREECGDDSVAAATRASEQPPRTAFNIPADAAVGDTSRSDGPPEWGASHDSWTLVLLARYARTHLDIDLLADYVVQRHEVARRYKEWNAASAKRWGRPRLPLIIEAMAQWYVTYPLGERDGGSDDDHDDDDDDEEGTRRRRKGQDAKELAAVRCTSLLEAWQCWCTVVARAPWHGLDYTKLDLRSVSCLPSPTSAIMEDAYAANL